jgi:tetratricopeptide (TPR) repeat protein
MTKTGTILFVVAILVVILATGWGLNLYNTRQLETQQKAIASLDNGISLFRGKKYTESLETLQSIPDGAIEDWHLPYYTASAHVMLKDYQTAAPILEQALAINPQETLILFELGVVYFKLGKLDLAKGYFAAVVEIDPGNKEAKGLMDIMANLERQQPEAQEDVTTKDDQTGAEDH